MDMQDAMSALTKIGVTKAASVMTSMGHGDGALGSDGRVKYHAARKVPRAVATDADSTCRSRSNGNSNITIPAINAIRGGINLPMITETYFLNRLDTTNQTFSFLSRKRRVK